MNNGYLLIFYTFCSFVRSFVEFELSVSKFLWRFVQNSFHFWKLRVKNSLHAFTFAVEKYCHSHPSGARIQFVGYFTQFVVMFIVWLAERKYSNMSKMSLNHCNSFFFELCVQCVCFWNRLSHFWDTDVWKKLCLWNRREHRSNILLVFPNFS